MAEQAQQERILTGIPVSPGVAEGPVFVYSRLRPGTIPHYTISENEVENEIQRLEEALTRTRQQIKQLRERLAKALGSEEQARLFDAHLLILEDPALYEQVIDYISRHRVNVEHAFAKVAAAFVSAFESLEDAYMRERAVDVRDVTNRILHNLINPTGQVHQDLQEIVEPVILVASDLTPSEAASLDVGRVIGLATDTGSQTSHVAILARALGIPAVTGLRNASVRLKGNEWAILDGFMGQLIIYPSERVKRLYQQVSVRLRRLEERFADLRDKPAVTPDGKRIILSANIETPKEVPLVLEYGAEGVGLFRTEYLFLGRKTLPDEEEQYQAYIEVARAVYPHPVIIRTLDVGGDKMLALEGAPPERNPFLGWRAIRICLQEQEIFRQQIRAVLRASVLGNVKMMYPMVSDLEELLQANAFVEKCKEELRAAGVQFKADMEIGVMIEVPSAAIQARSLAQRTHFFSIGTNDLIQYTLAVDRMNPRIAHLYKPTHPAVIHLIQRTIEAAHEHQIWVGVCGEAAADPVLVPLLLGLGADELSVTPRMVPLIKYVIRNCPMQMANELASFALRSESADEVRKRAEQFLLGLMPELKDMI